jgi:hypothetical protein
MSISIGDKCYIRGCSKTEENSIIARYIEEEKQPITNEDGSTGYIDYLIASEDGSSWYTLCGLTKV